MKKFLVSVFALALALALSLSVSAYKKGTTFGAEWQGFLALFYETSTPKTPSTGSPVISEAGLPQSTAEENLSYDERIEKGNYFYDRGFLTYAASEYAKAAQLESQRQEPYQKLMMTYFGLGDYEKARLNGEALLKLNPKSTEAALMLIQVYLKQSDFASAEGILGSLSGTDDPAIEYYKALIALGLGRFDEGKSSLAKAEPLLKGTPYEAPIHDFMESFKEFEFAEAGDPLYLSELVARSFNRIGEYEMALHLLKDILRQRSDLRDSWILMGFAYLNLEKYYFALTAFEKAYQIDPEWPSTQYFLGLTYAELKKLPEAITYFRYAMGNGFEPKVVVLRKLADLYLEIQNYEEAVKAYKSILESNKTDISAFVRPIWIYLDFLNKPADALSLAKLAAETFPNDAMSYNLLGWSLMGMGSYPEAETNLKKAIELNPSFPAAHYNLGKLYSVTGREDEALKTLQKAYELDPNGSIGPLAAEKYNEILKTK